MDPKPNVLDDIIRIQAQNESQVPLIAYPREGTVADFELFTARDLDILIERAARYYNQLPIHLLQDPIVALIGPSDLDYLITKFALSRLGFGVLLLSTRLSSEACLKLLKEIHCGIIIQSPSKLSYNLGFLTQEIDESLNVYSIATSSVYWDSYWDSQQHGQHNINSSLLGERTAIVYHSSGSTGLPKSIATSHEKLLSPIPTGKGTKALTSSPLCHAFASKLTINCMMAGKCMYLASASMPATSDNLVEICLAVKPDVFLTVPYVLKLMAETEAGVHELIECKQVVSSGSQLSDELGNRLVQEGVNVETLFAGTEPGMVGSSMNRPPGDDAWDYIRLVPAVHQNVQFKPLGNNSFEFVYLKSLPTLNMSNSNDPPGSFHSSDIMTPHPTIPNAWKYIGRIDDRVTLSTGEKVLPLPTEGRVREEALVREAVVFGIDKAIPGLLVFRSDAAKDLSDDEFVAKVWPAIEEANATSEAFGRIDKDMIVCLAAGVHVPAADKESIIRAKVYKLYEEQIQAAYDKMEKGSEGGLVLNLPELEQYILELVRNGVGVQVPDLDSDFHQAGMDSLQAIRLRGMMLKKLAFGGDRGLSANVVFQSGNVRRLARKISGSEDLDHGSEQTDTDELALMDDLIKKYSSFSPFTSGVTPRSKDNCVLITGATGSLGAHLLSQLLTNPNVSEIQCVVRGEDPKSRVLAALKHRNLPHESFSSKVRLINIDLSQTNSNLGSILQTLKPQPTHIIHAAWPVNFQLRLQAFEPHISGLHILIQLAQSTSARLLFCSSISVALATPLTPALIPETAIPSLKHAQATGYARSKLVCERIIEEAVSRSDANVDACILRIGQAVGDTRQGIWNDSEAWPLMIRSALTLGILPVFDMTCSWLPVDTLASSILEITFGTSTPTILNLENPHRFHWTKHLLPALLTCGLDFQPVAPKYWIRKLIEYQESSITLGQQEEEEAEVLLGKNPAVKILGYFEDFVGRTPEFVDGGDEKREEVLFDTEKARECSEGLRTAPDVLAEGLVGKFLARWMDGWVGGWVLE